MSEQGAANSHDLNDKQDIFDAKTCQSVPLQWRHNGRDSLSNHQPHDCLLYRLFRRRSKKTSKLRVTGLCVGNSPGTGEFPAQMASYAENVSIWWRHHADSWELKRIQPKHANFVFKEISMKSSWMPISKASRWPMHHCDNDVKAWMRFPYLLSLCEGIHW